MTKQQKLDIRDKCFTVHKDSGCLYVRAPEKTGYEHILCVEGDRRVLATAFDQYVACDVFEHYVLCRDINFLSNQTAGPFSSADILNKEIQFVYKNINDTGTLQIQTGEQLATVTTRVTQTQDEKKFSFGDEHNTITFTEQGTKQITMNGRLVTVTFISFETAVFTIDQVFKLGFPANAIGGLDDLAAETVFQDHPPVSNITAMVDEVVAETVLQDHVNLFTPSAAIDDLAAELVLVDHVDPLLPPTDLTVIRNLSAIYVCPPG